MLPRRIFAGSVYFLLWLVIAWLGGSTMWLAISLVSLVALLELRWVANRRRMRLAVEVAYPVALGFVYVAYRFADDLNNYAVAILALLFVLIVADFALHLHPTIRSSTACVSLTVFGTIYCGLMMSCLVLIRGYEPYLLAETAFGSSWPLGQRLLFFLLAVTMLSDVAAYVINRGVGRHELRDTVSPHKTMEAILGGIVVAVVAAVFIAGPLFNVGAVPSVGQSPEQFTLATMANRLMLGLMLGLFGQLGDLGASIFKHEAEVESFGWMVPGQAGILDRFDSLLLTAPLVYLYAHLVL